MTGKWTPGRWSPRIDHNGRHEVVGPGMHTVAVVYHTPDGLGASNTDLIAAAPALYEALDALIGELEVAWEARILPATATRGETIQAAQKALSQALGEGMP